MNEILFYTTRGPHGFYSNFSKHSVWLPLEWTIPTTWEEALISYDRSTCVEWKTSEAAYQAYKSLDLDVRKSILEATKPSEAARIGRTCWMRPDWEHTSPVELGFKPKTRIKDLAMFQVCLAKFRQHKDIQKAHLATGTETIVEDTVDDLYWGWGKTKLGINMLGQVHMLTRDVFRKDLR